MNDLDKFSLFLASISEKEAELKAQALYLRYMDPNRTKRRTVEEVAQFMGLPIERYIKRLKLDLSFQNRTYDQNGVQRDSFGEGFGSCRDFI